MIRFEPLPARPPDWDRIIAQYDAKTLFHESAWLDHVQSIHPRGRIVYFEIRRDGALVGHYCGLRITKALIPIHGSPLGGTGTNFMGPLVQRDVDQREVVRALRSLAGPRHFLHLELASQWFDPELMRAEGFTVHQSVTHVISIAATKEETWAAMRGPARNRVRKAQGNGLVVERTEDPAIVDHFFDQFVEVYGKQGMVTPFGRERAQSLYRHLMPAGRLLPMWVRHGEEIVAAGLFPYDEKAIYFWGAGSWIKHHALCPNEALHWGVMEFAIANRIPLYNMCGGKSQFKDKFGGTDVPNLTYYRSFIPGLQTARRLYRTRHFKKLRSGAPQVESAAEPPSS